jgi:aspartyl-tRNA synthetase
VTFAPLRDRYGTTQLLLDGQSRRLALAGPDGPLQLAGLPPESVVSVEGSVQPRPSGAANATMPTGAVEIVVSRIELLNPAARDLPFTSATKYLANEELRLQHRYLDLRRAELQANLALRSRLVHAMRSFLLGHDFLEVETPTLFKATPEGAREFLVPTRRRDAAGAPMFYALAQSPQQYKQMLMAAGMDRYFQLARCYRDEGG